eukprot:evm.model.NODE_19166_length_72781_cov_34.074345.3
MHVVDHQQPHTSQHQQAQNYHPSRRAYLRAKAVYPQGKAGKQHDVRDHDGETLKEDGGIAHVGGG